jgi:D-lactate dehydrogenase (cytochrome)
MPDVKKLSAGYFSPDGPLDLIDLFIGSEGTLGIVVEATLRVVPRPKTAVVLIACRDDEQAIGVNQALGDEARLAWKGAGPLDVCAVEYMDAQSLTVVDEARFAASGLARHPPPAALLLVQMELQDDEGPALARLQQVLDANGVLSEPAIALSGDTRAAAALIQIREAVPAGVNAGVAAAKATVDPRIEKTAGDMVMPVGRLRDAMAVYHDELGRRALRHAIWGHFSDGNLHPNVIPGSFDDVRRGREAMLVIAGRVIEMGGAPLAEHGVGRSPLKQEMLRMLWGDAGIEQMRAVKRALDPDWKLSPGVLFAAP